MNFDRIPTLYQVNDLDGRPRFILNRRLMIRQKATHNLKKIKRAHELRLVFLDMMEETDDRKMLRWLASMVMLCDYQIQALWKFKKNKKYFRFWCLPKCTCPKDDNELAYPSGPYWTDLTCPIHGTHK